MGVKGKPHKITAKPKAKRASPGKTARTKIKGKIDTAGKRWYTDDERISYLNALAANGGAIEVTARQLGIPYSTLYGWANGARCPEALLLRNEKAGDLAKACEEIAWLFLATIPEKVGDAPLNHLTQGAGTMIDKMRILQGLPTSYGQNANLSATLDVNRLSDVERAAFYALLTKCREPEPGAPLDGGTARGDPPTDAARLPLIPAGVLG